MRLFSFLFAAWMAMGGLVLAAGQITVTGEGEVLGAPDMATITMGAIGEGATARDALSQVSTKVRALLARLEAEGIEARDIQTSGLSLSPRWKHPKNAAPRIEGFQASNMVTVRVRDLDKLGAVLDGVVSDGANQFHGLQFGLSEPRPALDEARRRAVRDGRAKAELLAEAAGVALGPLVMMSEVGGGRPPVMPMARMEMAAESVPIAGGEVGIAARVTLVYEIAEK